MSDRLHEMIGEIAILHDEFIKNGKINSAKDVLEEISIQEEDLREHYQNLLLQYYFQQNDLKNLKELLLVGSKFDMRLDDIKKAFLNINSSEENVIEFMEDNVVFVKDNHLDDALFEMYEYYQRDINNQVNLEQALNIVRKNRYICAYAFKNSNHEYANFFLNNDLLESLKKDLPYLLK